MKDPDQLDEENLRALHPEPKDYVVNAYSPCLDDAASRFIGASSMLLSASLNQDKDIDISPRGGEPGFVKVLDNKHLAFVSEMGNNKLMTLSNLTNNSQIGLMFIVPGVTDMLRLYGRATVINDADFIQSLGGKPKRNITAVRIEISKVFPHCSTALNRSGFWKPDRWPDKKEYKIPDLTELGTGLTACREALEK